MAYRLVAFRVYDPTSGQRTPLSLPKTVTAYAWVFYVNEPSNRRQNAVLQEMPTGDRATEIVLGCYRTVISRDLPVKMLAVRAWKVSDRSRLLSTPRLMTA